MKFQHWIGERAGYSGQRWTHGADDNFLRRVAGYDEASNQGAIVCQDTHPGGDVQELIDRRINEYSAVSRDFRVQRRDEIASLIIVNDAVHQIEQEVGTGARSIVADMSVVPKGQGNGPAIPPGGARAVKEKIAAIKTGALVHGRHVVGRA